MAKDSKAFTLVVSLLWCAMVFAQNITVYTIGDSTMADKENPENNPERGWAQMLTQFFTDPV